MSETPPEYPPLDRSQDNSGISDEFARELYGICKDWLLCVRDLVSDLGAMARRQNAGPWGALANAIRTDVEVPTEHTIEGFSGFTWRSPEEWRDFVRDTQGFNWDPVKNALVADTAALANALKQQDPDDWEEDSSGKTAPEHAVEAAKELSEVWDRFTAWLARA
ncbi:hypothetical protein [Streptomyces sp. 900105245]